MSHNRPKAPTPARPSEPVVLQIHDVGYRGPGVARLNGQVVFCPDTLVGETVKARILSHHKRFAQAEVEAVLTPSPHRIVPVCPLTSVCPGCAYQHATYEEELRIKSAQLAGFLRRLPGFGDRPAPGVTASPRPLGYRNKLVLHVQHRPDGVHLGYVGKDNQTVFDVPDCPLATPEIGASLTALLQDRKALRALPDGARITWRHTADDGVHYWIGSAPESGPPLTETTPLGPLSVPRGAFFQINPGAAALLVARVRQWLAGMAPAALLDAYCGVGVFALAARAAGIARVAGIDCDAGAIAAARTNAASLGFNDIDFSAQPAEKGIPLWLQHLGGSGPAVVLVDPPRTGLPAPAIAALLQTLPPFILYISCAPDTLARDLEHLVVDGAYAIQEIELIDMFPRTAHFETLVLLKRATAAPPRGT